MHFDYGLAEKYGREAPPEEPYTPNRAERRAMEKAQRSAQRRGQRAYDREQARKAAELRKLKAEVAALTGEERAQLAQVIQEREARAGQEAKQAQIDHVKKEVELEKRAGTPDPSDWQEVGYTTDGGVQR